MFCDGGSLLLADFLFSDFVLQLFDCTVFCLEHRIRMCYKFHSVETSLTSINLVYLVYKIGLVFLYIAVKDTKQAKASLKLLTDYVSSCSCMWKKSAVFDDFKGVF